MQDMTFYEYPWAGPTKAVVEYKGQMYDVREGYGRRERWTNNHIAIAMSDEEVHQYGDELFEIDPKEVEVSFDEDDLQGIREALENAHGV